MFCIVLHQIKVLEDELSDGCEHAGVDLANPKHSLGTSITKGLHQMKPLFVGSYFSRLLLVVTIQCGGMLW